MATVVPISHAGTEIAVYDQSFDDIEDSFQFHCALENGCEVLITVNEDDFKNADQSEIKVLTPSAFVERYINEDL